VNGKVRGWPGIVGRASKNERLRHRPRKIDDAMHVCNTSLMFYCALAVKYLFGAQRTSEHLQPEYLRR
jgi:hypothetical protein